VHSSQPVTFDYTKIPTPDWTLNSLKPAKPRNEVFDYSL
jgi:hypothetical protein